MESISLTPELIVAVAGAIISLLASYVPKFNVWFAALETEVKQLVMLGLMVIVTAVVFAGGCLDFLPVENFSCDKNTAVQFIYLLIIAIVSNQSVHRISPKTESVRSITQ